MKNFAILLFMTATFTLCNAQKGLWLYPSKPDSPKHGISKNLTYSTIISTTKPKKEVLNIVISFLDKNGYLDVKNNKIKNINDKLDEITFDLQSNDSYFNGAGTMGVKIMRCPVVFSFSCFMKFNAEGQVAVTLTNFNEKSFLGIKDGIFSDNEDGFNEAQKASKQQLWDLYNDEFASTNAIMKLFTVIAVLKDPSAMLKYNEDSASRRKNVKTILDKAVENNIAKLIPMNELSNYFAPTTKSGVHQYNDNFKTLINDKISKDFLIAMDNDRWNKRFETSFNNLFLSITAAVNGTLEGIALDGNVKYELKNDELKKVKK